MPKKTLTPEQLAAQAEQRMARAYRADAAVLNVWWIAAAVSLALTLAGVCLYALL